MHETCQGALKFQSSVRVGGAPNVSMRIVREQLSLNPRYEVEELVT